MDVVTRADFFAIGRDYIQQRAKKLDPAQVDIEGSDANLYTGTASVIAQVLMRQMVERTAALLLDGANDEDLDRYAYDRYRLTRKGASSARMPCVITRATVLAGAGTVPIGTTILTDNNVEYVTTSVAVFGASATTATCNVRATQAGSATRVGKLALKRFSNPQSLFDATLVPTNPTASAGGEDVEKDPVFRERIRDFWRTARRGILAAIEQGALTVEGVVSARAVEALNSEGLPARVVYLYIADSSGVASETLAEDVRVALNEWRAAGIAVIVKTSLPTIAAISLKLNFAAGVDTTTLTDLIRASVFEFVNSLPVNGPLYIGELYTVLQRFKQDGLIPSEGNIVAPAGDLFPAVGQTIRTTLDAITIA